ncbi:hypothetical protein N0V90_008262 [Kalmusia sp. IMI 367209]|nr:hypothetical protein N0V90_008262 [Kalmusia sp. IMI 367209]
MPHIYALSANVWYLPGSVSPQAVVECMRKGLERTVQQFPNIAGELEYDDRDGRMWIRKDKEGGISLYVKSLENDFPSFAELERKHFPDSMLLASKLLPQFTSEPGFVKDKSIPTTVFQINFIRGGMVLGFAIHHVITDGASGEDLMTTWAANSRAALQGQPFPPLDKNRFDLLKSALEVPKPSPERFEELKGLFPQHKDAGGPVLPPPDVQLPKITSMMFHFPRSKAAKLKAVAASKLGGTRISTYDTVVALMWQSITRARLAFLKPDLDAPSKVCHAADSRKIWDPPVLERFVSCSALVIETAPLSLRELIDPANHHLAVAAIRGSITSLSPVWISKLQELVAAHHDKRWIEFQSDSFLGLDVFATSWAGMSTYQKYDFGWGVSRAIRWPSLGVEGFVFVYPNRSGMEGTGPEEGVETCVCLEEECMQRLIRDPLLREWCAPRGEDGADVGVVEAMRSVL